MAGGTRYLLDTNVLSALIRDPHGRVAKQVAASDVCTSVVVACELRYGATKKGSARLTERVEALLAVLDVLPLDLDSARHYGDLRTTLERNGTPIGANDLLIASQALASDAVMVTANQREFARVPRLRVENWIPSP